MLETYEIENIVDILKVPREKRARCICELVRLLASFEMTCDLGQMDIGDPNIRGIMKAFHWTDDDIDGMKEPTDVDGEFLPVFNQSMKTFDDLLKQLQQFDMAFRVFSAFLQIHHDWRMENDPTYSGSDVALNTLEILKGEFERESLRAEPKTLEKQSRYPYPRLTTKTLETFLADFHAGKYPDQRLGQAASWFFALRVDSAIFNQESAEESEKFLRQLCEDYQA